MRRPKGGAMFEKVANLLSEAWKLLSEGDDKRSNVALAIASLCQLAAIGLVVVGIYGAFAPATSGIAPRVTSATIALMAASAAFGAGAAFGFLFGAPRWGDSAGPGAGSGAAGSEAGAAPAGSAAAVGGGRELRPNTSLERVTDWLTTIIVGLGLVHLKDMKNEVTDLGIWLTGAIVQKEVTNATPGVLIVLSFAVIGFLVFYLWSTRFLPREMGNLFDKMQKLEDTARKASEAASKAEEQAQTSLERLERFRNEPRFVLGTAELDENRKILVDAGFSAEDVEEVIARLSKARTWNDEPFLGFGPPELSGRRIDIKVAASPEYVGNYDLKLSIVCSGEQLLPGAKVAYLLHQTYSQPVVVVDAAGAVQPTEMGPVAESFVIGALIQEPGKPSIRLSLDAATAPGVPPEFIAP